MNEQERGQVVRSAAEVYESFFVPALFGEWAPRVMEAAAVAQGQDVLDVGCGTGVLARHVAQRVGPTGSVTGLDVNDGMLEVARRHAPDVDWRKGAAEALPFEGSVFDAAVSQFAAMFFDDRAQAVREMARVVRSGGQIALAVWGPVEQAAGYADLVSILDDTFGEEAANALRAPFALGDVGQVSAMFEEAKIDGAEVRTEMGTARFRSIHDWMHTDIRGWTLSEMINDEQFEALVERAELELAGYVGPDGAVSFAMPAHIACATV